MDGKAVIEGAARRNGKATASMVRLAGHPPNGNKNHELDSQQARPANNATAVASLSINDMHGRVDHALGELKFEVPTGADRLAEAARYSLLAGGKRLRPVLVMATAQAMGAMTDYVLPTACAIELLHTNSLIVDDLPGDGQSPKATRTASAAPSIRRRRGDSGGLCAAG